MEFEDVLMSFQTFSGYVLQVGDTYKQKGTDKTAKITKLEMDPHWICAVTLEGEGEQPYEYLLRNWTKITRN